MTPELKLKLNHWHAKNPGLYEITTWQSVCASRQKIIDWLDTATNYQLSQCRVFLDELYYPVTTQKRQIKIKPRKKAK
jgi:hypothetical protein